MVLMTQPRISHRDLGFSLLEMVVSLALVSILVGFFVYHFSTDEQSGELPSFRTQLERFVIKTARSANAFDEDRVIVLNKNQIRSEGAELTVPESIRLTIKRDEETQFRSPDNDQWVFLSRGLVEPIQLRLVEGSQTVEIKFDPLTARPVRNNL